jgi:phosphohistidine swiveling domain-containing protein
MMNENTTNEKNWFPVITRKGQPVLFNSYVLTGYQDLYYEEVLRMPRGIHSLKYAEGQVILEENDSAEFAKQLAQNTNPEYLQFFIDKCRDESDNLLQTAKKIESEAPYDSKSNSELAVLLTRYNSAVFRTMTFLTTIVVFEDVLQDHVESQLASHCEEHNIDAEPENYLSSLIFPQEESIPSQALIDLYQLGDEVESNSSLSELFEMDPDEILDQMGEYPEFEQNFEEYLEEYDFMNMEYYAGQPLQPKGLVERINDVKSQAKERLKRIRQDQQRKEKELEQAIKELDLTAESKSLIDSTREIHYLRQYRADALFKAGRRVRRLFETIGDRLGISYDEIVYMTHDEIVDSVLEGELTVEKETIRARQDRYAIIWDDQERSIVTGDAVDDELEAVATGEEKIKELEGNVAFSGEYQGSVSIVTDSDEIDKVQDGDVLVSPMTDPYFVPAMLRAGAIITDEGGILSHAAIVSRELGIPCVVGTETATSALEDGSDVEVDASGDVGTIRVISGE